jgi:TRIAD3 protein (E3 ubiquitin-protein ligase RNF216)
MVQCPETHLFCVSCMTTCASALFSEHNSHIQCIDQSGCTALIPESELRRFLPEKMVRMWESISQHAEIMEARLAGLVECPFCNYVVVIENKEERLLRCGNEECGVVSCRACKKPVGPFHPCILFPGEFFISVSRTIYQSVV